MISRWTRPPRLLSAFAGCLLGASACAAQVATRPADSAPAPQPGVLDFTKQERTRIGQHSPLPPVPPDPTNAYADHAGAAHFGQFLFFDPRLSANGKISCATCHDPKQGFSDGRKLPAGMTVGTRNTQSVWNAAYHRWYFWDGRADTLWSQALGPMEGDHEFGSSRIEIARVVSREPDLRRAYESVFGVLTDLSDASRIPARGHPVPENPEHELHRAWMAMQPGDRESVNRVVANVAKAMAAYQRKLVSKDSPFDRFAAALKSGDTTEAARYPLAAQRGLRTFVGKGNCRLCHSGPLFSDGEFHDIRVPPLGGGAASDSARYDGVKRLLASDFSARAAMSDRLDGPAAEKIEFLKSRPEFWGQFKTPSLRNVARTPPYMHQGQFAGLRDVLHYYSTLENALPPNHHGARETVLVPLALTTGEMEDLIAFLETLTDENVPAELLKRPESPVSANRQP